MGGLRPAREVAPRGGGRPHREAGRALREAGHPAQVRGVVVEDRVASLGVSAAGRRVERVDGPAPPGGHDPPRLRDRAVGEGVLRGLPAVDLAGGRRADVVALRGVVAEVRERVGARRDRLRLERLDLREGLGRQLVRDHAPEVVLEVDDVHDGQRRRLGGPHLEEPPVACRVRLAGARPGRRATRWPARARPRSRGGAAAPPPWRGTSPGAACARRTAVSPGARPWTTTPESAPIEARATPGRTPTRIEGCAHGGERAGGRRGDAGGRRRDASLHRAAGGGHDPGPRQRRDPGRAGVIHDALSGHEPCGASL